MYIYLSYNNQIITLGINMKNLTTIALFVASLAFTGCGSSDDTEENTNTYDLRTVNLSTEVSALLSGAVTVDGDKVNGTLSIFRLNDGEDNLNGTVVARIKGNSNLTLDDGYKSTNSDISYIDVNGVILATEDLGDGVYCTLSTDPIALPKSAPIGTKSTSTAIYTCDDGSNTRESWELTNAGNGNAYYTISLLYSSTNTENTETYTITPTGKVIYYRVESEAGSAYLDFEGAVD